MTGVETVTAAETIMSKGNCFDAFSYMAMVSVEAKPPSTNLSHCLSKILIITAKKTEKEKETIVLICFTSHLNGLIKKDDFL